MNLKRIIAIVLVMLFITTIPMSVFASTVTEADLENNTRTMSVPVGATVQATFTVSLPATITLALSGENNGLYKFDSVVGVKGDIIAGAKIKVEPNTTVTLYDVSYRPSGTTSTPTSEEDQAGYSHKAPTAGTVSQGALEWSQSELVKTVNEGESKFTYDSTSGFHNVALNVDVADLKSGTWEGTVKFTISYIEH